MASTMLRGLSALAVTTSVLAISTPAYAQTVDEIIVTATKKEESLQDVSMSIAAFDVEALEVNRIEGLEDIAQFTPGLFSYPSAANSSGLRISLRGVGTFDPQLGLDSKVALYTDGVYMGKTVGLAFDSPDLARVEVLKGPQGTLYGRNAVAGAINLISAAPDPSDTYGSVEVEVGNYGALGLEGVLNFAMGDKAAARLSVQHDKRDGWVENTGLGEDWAGYDRFGIRGAFGIEFSPDVYFELAGDYNDAKSTPFFYQSVPVANPGALFAASVSGATFDRIEEWSAIGDVVEGSAVNKGVSAKLEYDYDENHSMKLVAAWRGLDSDRGVALNPMSNPLIVEGIINADLDQNPANGIFSINTALQAIPNVLALTPGPNVRPDYFQNIPRSPIGGLFQTPPGETSPTVDGHSQISLEATFNGSFGDGKIDYTAGLFYFDEETGTGRSSFNGIDAQDYLDMLAPAFGFVPAGLACGQLSQLPGLPAQFYSACSFGGVTAMDQATAGFLAGAASNALRGTLSQVRLSTGNILDIDTESYAAYGQFTYHVSDDLRLIGGLRYTDEQKVGVQQNVSPFFRDFTNLLGGPIAPQSAKVSFDSLDPQAIVEFDVNDDVMIYASYSQAFRSGGFNASASLPAVPPATVGNDFIFQPEEITAYEAGFKSTLGDGRVQLNAAGFYYDIPNEQITVGINPLISTQRAIVNVETEVWGAEADLTAALTDEWTFRGSMSWVDGDPGFPVNPVSGAIVPRDQLQGSPELSYSASMNYDGTLENGMRLFGNVSYSHKDEVEATPFLFFGERDLVDARVGVGLKNGARIAFWGQNLFDETYTIDAIGFETFVNRVMVYGTPRTYGVTLGYDF